MYGCKRPEHNVPRVLLPQLQLPVIISDLRRLQTLVNNNHKPGWVERELKHFDDLAPRLAWTPDKHVVTRCHLAAQTFASVEKKGMRCAWAANPLKRDRHSFGKIATPETTVKAQQAAMYRFQSYS